MAKNMTHTQQKILYAYARMPGRRKMKYDEVVKKLIDETGFTKSVINKTVNGFILEAIS